MGERGGGKEEGAEEVEKVGKVEVDEGTREVEGKRAEGKGRKDEEEEENKKNEK